MKKLLLILSLVFVCAAQSFAQNDDDGNEKIRDKMREFIQKRLNLTRGEAERFTPVFLRYFREWRTTLRENKGDVIMMQKRVAEVRLQYRNQFKEIIGERRSNEVYIQQDVFIHELRNLRNRNEGREVPARRNRLLQ
jgi:hypothetical protein